MLFEVDGLSSYAIADQGTRHDERVWTYHPSVDTADTLATVGRDREGDEEVSEAVGVSEFPSSWLSFEPRSVYGGVVVVVVEVRVSCLQRIYSKVSKLGLIG